VTELLKSFREPFFLECGNRRLFSIFHSPENRDAIHGGVVYFAPFTEEANRARRMASLLAENLSGTGTGALLFDYSSVGDSSGNFSQARWDDWVSDGCAAIDWLYQKIGGPISVVGLRLGAVVALKCAQNVGRDISRIVLWQPVTNGRTYFTQFLRIRLAAALAESGARETTKDLMERLSGGETLEIAGYKIGPALADAVTRTDPADIVPPLASKVHWFEVTTGENYDLLPPSEKTVLQWREAGVDVTTAVVAGEQFWATQEITTTRSLIDATRFALAEARA
jgi:exosortase A-associated hydrolase 2